MNLLKNSSRRRLQTTAIPPLVYEAILGWARQHLDIGDRPVIGITFFFLKSY